MALDKSARQKILNLARRTIAAHLEGRPEPPLEAAEKALGQNQGAFVTLHRQEALRGCIGQFEGQGALARTIQDMALSAAFRDPRFSPLSSFEELEECDIEVSVLSPLKESRPEEVEVGRHGVYIVKGFNRGVLLPQVAVEQGWDREAFLDHTCLKAGLSPGCWRDPEAQILTFEAEVFGEKDEEDLAPPDD